MQKVFGDKKRINLGSSVFRKFIESGSLYVDKTMFIEHVLEEASDVLLFTRPRRTGKSLNLNMLRTFLDCKQDTAELFSGLYIDTRPVFEQINSVPVIYMSFRELNRTSYEAMLRAKLEESACRYLNDTQVNNFINRCFVGDFAVPTMALYYLTKEIHDAFGMSPLFLIRGYKFYSVGNQYILSRSSSDSLRVAMRDSSNGIQVREICRGTYLHLPTR